MAAGALWLEITESAFLGDLSQVVPIINRIKKLGVLLALDDPVRVIARSRFNILEPREVYEQVGQVPNVVFPSGMVVDRFDAEGFAEPDAAVSVYYGAADTVVGLATTTISELIEACHEGGERNHE